MLKDWLKQNSVPFTAYDLSRDVERREEVIKKTGQMAVPVIEIDDEIIIGFDKKKLSELLGLN
jgi:glutaredoxin